MFTTCISLLKSNLMLIDEFKKFVANPVGCSLSDGVKIFEIFCLIFFISAKSVFLKLCVICAMEFDIWHSCERSDTAFPASVAIFHFHSMMISVSPLLTVCPF
jgi:hypothetical protein